MNNKGFTLSLVGTDGHRTVISPYQIVLLIVGTVLLITIATFVLSSLPFTSSDPSISAVEIDAHTARWIAVGERYRGEELNSERVAAANIARWNALGERYSKGGADTAHVVDPSVARWIAQGERYLAEKLEAERIEKAYIARWNGLGARYQAMGQ